MYKFLTLYSVLVAAATIFSSPLRDDLAARGTSSTADRPYAAFVEYLESTGTQYIDTGITATTAIRPSIGFLGKQVGEFFFGGGDSSSSGFGLRFRGYGNETITVAWGWTKTLTYWNYQRAYPYDVVFFNSAGRMKLNNQGSNTLNFSETYSSTFALFGRNIGGIVTPCAVRIYYAKLGDLDLLPVRIGNEGFMLDTISGELFANQGTGSFIVGPDIAPLDL